MIDRTSPLSQLDLFNQNSVKSFALAEQSHQGQSLQGQSLQAQSFKPVSSTKPSAAQADPDYLFKIVSRMELMPDGSRKHYDGTGRLCLHSHAPEPKNYAYRTDNAGTTNRANSSALEQTSHQVHEICKHWSRMRGKQWLRMEDHLDYLHKMGVVVGKRELAEEYLFLAEIARQHRLMQAEGVSHD